MKTYLLGFLLPVSVGLSQAQALVKFDPKNAWLESEAPIAIDRILKNVSPFDTKPGAIVAAQTKVNPNYYYHWVRDAGLTADAMISQYQATRDSKEKAALRQRLESYVDFTESIQNISTLTGLGEPKFNVDGSAYNDPWGRPQNDGPAIRAVSLMHWLKVLENEGLSSKVRDRLYRATMPAESIIKRDLEYVSHHWRDASFDLWEEVKGDHFYTRIVQRRAMLEGAALANSLGDPGAANWYSQQAKEIEQSLAGFWDSSRGFVVTTKNRVEGLDYKKSDLDIAVILGLLHGSLADGFLPFSDPKVQATIDRLISAFANTYNINARAGIPGVAIGRYTEDRYGGASFNGGNPWVLTTLAVAEAYFRAAKELSDAGKKDQARELVNKGDSFVARVQYHAHPNGSLNEQFNRDTGFMTSVEDLTWNYAAILTTSAARRLAVAGL